MYHTDYLKQVNTDKENGIWDIKGIAALGITSCLLIQNFSSTNTWYHASEERFKKCYVKK